jgi:hypothetical protein
LIHATLGITFKAFNERFTSLARIAKQKLMRREELKGSGSTNKGYISGTSSKNYDQLKNLIYRENDQIRQESIANQETLQEEEEAKEQANAMTNGPIVHGKRIPE